MPDFSMLTNPANPYSMRLSDDSPLKYTHLICRRAKRIGGTPPENIAPAEHIKEGEKRLKSTTPKLELDERDAGGLLGGATDKLGDK